jgi:cytochrome c oxidase subunit 2
MVHNSDVAVGDILSTFACLVVSVASKYKVNLSAVDVIHSFTVPCLGFKIDCVPGRLSSLCFSSNSKSILHGQCSELCGSLHGFMPVQLLVL